MNYRVLLAAREEVAETVTGVLSAIGNSVIGKVCSNSNFYETINDINPDILVIDPIFLPSEPWADSYFNLLDHLNLPIVFIHNGSITTNTQYLKNYILREHISPPFHTWQVRYAIKSSMIIFNSLFFLKNHLASINSIFDNIPSIIFVFNCNFATTYSNKAANDFLKFRNLNPSQYNSLEAIFADSWEKHKNSIANIAPFAGQYKLTTKLTRTYFSSIYIHWIVKKFEIKSVLNPIYLVIGIDIERLKAPDKLQPVFLKTLTSEINTLTISNLSQSIDDPFKLKDIIRYIEQKNASNIAEMEANVITTLKMLVLPHIEFLNGSLKNEEQIAHLMLIKENLGQITDSFKRRIAIELSNLSTSELQIALFIRNGKSTKEISDLLGISVRTVHVHRDHIRKKLGIRGKRVNLYSYLKEMV